jgi:hypothetical protein
MASRVRERRPAMMAFTLTKTLYFLAFMAPQHLLVPRLNLDQLEYVPETRQGDVALQRLARACAVSSQALSIRLSQLFA